MRVFIAISPPEETKDSIGNLIVDLKKEFPQVNWVDSEKLHLTLAFLGMLAEEKVNTLKSTLRDTTPKFKPFDLELTDISYFYKKHDESIIYLDVVDKSGELKNFFRSLRRALLKRDIFLPERIDPHITIGRVKRVRYTHIVKDTLVEITRRKISRVGNFRVSSINIYHSMFSKSENSSNYRLLQSSPLLEPDTEL